MTRLKKPSQTKGKRKAGKYGRKLLTAETRYRGKTMGREIIEVRYLEQNS